MDADLIAPNLSIGSVPRSCGPFDVVVLAAYEHQNIRLPCMIIHAPLNDAVPSRHEIKTALLAAKKIQALRDRDANVLVTCAQGLNRSALIIALALMMEGMPADKVVRLIRRKRPGALFNKSFVALLHRYEEARHATHT